MHWHIQVARIGETRNNIPEVEVLIKSLIKKKRQERVAHWKKRHLRTVSHMTTFINLTFLWWPRF